MKKSKRHKTMAGGIQKGMVATDAHARKLDNQCKVLKEEIADVLQYTGVTLQKKLKKNQIPGGKGACEPDGGAWFYKGKLIAVFEGKKQQDAGNAIERWFKNNYICRKINPDVSYVTFAIGDGAYSDGVIGKALNVAHLDGFDTYNAGGNSCFFNTQGFTKEEIRAIMIKVLAERIQNEDS